MDYRKLDELIHMPKKSGASKEKRNQFYKEFMMLLDEEGYSRKAEECLFLGWSFCGVKPFFDYMKKSENKIEVYNSLTRGDKFNREKMTALQIELNLLALVINEDFKEKEIIKDILIRLPNLSINASNIRFKDLIVFVIKKYIEVISEKAVYPDINNIGVKPVNIKKLIEMFEDAFKNYEMKDDIEIEKIKKLNKWISSYRLSEEENIKKAEIVKNEKVKNEVSKGEKGATEVSVINRTDPGLDFIDKTLHIDNNEDCRQVLDKVMEFISKKDNEISAHKDNFNALNKEKAYCERSIKYLEKKISELNIIIEDNNIKINNLNNEKITMKDKINSLEESLMKKEREIEDRKKINEMTEKDNSKQYEEFINRISQKIKLEYTDYKDAEDAEMNIDLGENMRIQLKAVFDILEKSGIKIK